MSRILTEVTTENYAMISFFSFSRNKILIALRQITSKYLQMKETLKLGLFSFWKQNNNLYNYMSLTN